MKLVSFSIPGESGPRCGELRGPQVVSFGDSSDNALARLASGDLTPADGDAFPLARVRLLMPHRPQAIYGIGLNYRTHPLYKDHSAPRQNPVVFLKLPIAAAGPGAAVRCPPVVRELDYEGELAVVMGRNREIAGYTIANDLTARDLQRNEKQWARAKSFDGACPFGPWITTADEIPDPAALQLRTWINGELRQHGFVRDLVHSIPEIIDDLSQTFTLMPGDLILTGTPGGVGMSQIPPVFLKPSDTVRIAIDGLGVLEHTITGT